MRNNTTQCWGWLGWAVEPAELDANAPTTSCQTVDSRQCGMHLDTKGFLGYPDDRGFLLRDTNTPGFFNNKSFLLLHEHHAGRPRLPETLGNQAGVTRTREAAGHPS